MFMIRSNIKLTAAQESIGIRPEIIRKKNQRDLKTDVLRKLSLSWWALPTTTHPLPPAVPRCGLQATKVAAASRFRNLASSCPADASHLPLNIGENV